MWMNGAASCPRTIRTAPNAPSDAVRHGLVFTLNLSRSMFRRRMQMPTDVPRAIVPAWVGEAVMRTILEVYSKEGS